MQKEEKAFRESRSRGFTLIELLVTIAIIVLLAAILFPVFSRARERARQASCASNLKQLGLAFMQYSQDYDERLPPGIGNYAVGWGGQLYTYVKSEAVYTCPDDPTPQGSTDGQGTHTSVSYWYNFNIGTVESCCTIQGQLAQLTTPPSTVLLAEGNVPTNGVVGLDNFELSKTHPGDCTVRTEKVCSGGTDGSDQFTNGGAYVNGLATGPLGRDCAVGASNYRCGGASSGRHSDGANYLLADGHVKWFRGDQVSRGQFYGPTYSNVSQRSTTTAPQTTGRAAGTMCTVNCDGNGGTPFAITFSPM